MITTSSRWTWRHIAGAIPDARLVVLRECGHFSFLEQPDAVHTAVAELLGLR